MPRPRLNRRAMPQAQPIPPGYEETTATNYPWSGGEESTGADEAVDEAAVLLALAVEGGDLTAHRTIHLGEGSKHVAALPAPSTPQ